jgi:hypothetical protein
LNSEEAAYQSLLSSHIKKIFDEYDEAGKGEIPTDK